MRGRVTVAVFVLIGIVAGGLMLTSIVARRHEAARVQCLNNLRLHGRDAADVFDLLGKLPPELRTADVPGAVPAGTLFVAGRPPEDRLSWIADTLGGMSQAKQSLTELAARIDRSATWDGGANADVGRTRLVTFTCPANIPAPPAGTPAVTQYVGLAGLGLDAATLSLGPPVPPRAGCFRYDAPTPFGLIQSHDGVDTTLLFAEVSGDLGPWMRGGPATVRGLDDAPTAKPAIGFGGQFGGNHPDGVAAVAYASGAAKFLTPRIDPAVLRAMVTIRGDDADGIPGGE